MEQLVKLIITGDSGVGKSSIIMRFADNIYDDFFLPTIGLDFSVKKFKIEDKLYKLHMWDLAGQERFKSIVKTYYRNGQGIILAFDITNMESFKSLQRWVSDIDKFSPANSVLILVGTKSDLEENRQVSYEKADDFAKTLKIDYIEISSKKNINIEDMFELLIKKIQIQLDIQHDIDNKKIKLELKKRHKKCCK